MISCTVSDAPELYMIATLIAAYTNAHCHVDLKDLPEAERLAKIEEYKQKFLEIAG